MKHFNVMISFCLAVLILGGSCAKKEDSMAWFREARFGLFVHWGLYAIPAGEWKGGTTYGEWIRHHAEIPREVYSQYLNEFNPVNFDATVWVDMAKNAGMKYIVITSKHHDGFCLFDSEFTEFDVMSTPFQRDIMQELADAAHAADIKICWYYSIMDWHHDDYLPRRPWETHRSAEGADYERFITYMKNQLKELVNNYGDIGILWFDGEWEETWNAERGWDLYTYLKDMDEDLIINNRVGKGRGGMAGLTKAGEFAGDYGTPEQEIPATGLPGLDWETCMTMNKHWGWNKNDNTWKSTEALIQNLADIASKGGNFLLNVGPKADGTFPEASVDRLAAMGEWMAVNGESIYGTQASPFESLKWGRCTQKPISDGTRLYLHVFDWPAKGQLVVPGIYNEPLTAFLLAKPKVPLLVSRREDALIIQVPEKACNEMNTVVVLDVKGKPDISHPPVIEADQAIFLESITVSLQSDRESIEIRYTTDGQAVTSNSTLYQSPVELKETTTVLCRAFRDGRPVSQTASRTFEKVIAEKAMMLDAPRPGIVYDYYEGEWEALPDFTILSPKFSGRQSAVNLNPALADDAYGLVFTGYVKIPRDGIYTFYIDSDDGSRLFINGNLVIDNDGIHAAEVKSRMIALTQGYHAIQIDYFERSGGAELNVSMEGPGMPLHELSESVLYYEE